MTIDGIDVSDWQGEIHWSRVAAAGNAFAVAKASEGYDFIDQHFQRNWTGIRDAGIVRGAYHFARPSQGSPKADADHFLSVVDRYGGLESGDFLVLDMEDTDVAPGVSVLQWTLEWLHAVEHQAGFLPLLYSGTWFMEPHGLTGNALLAEHGLWLAAYQTTEPLPPDPWEFLAIWQYSSNIHVPGIAGPVDGNKFNGDISQLRRYGKP